jgi:hypothetical protein
LDIPFKNKTYPFVPWNPRAGRVMTRTFAFDTETTLIEDARPWLIPAYVLGAAFDGRTGVFVPRDRVAAFFKAHEGLPFVAHNAAFDLKVIKQVAPDLDIYKVVDENRVWDTMLLFQLLVLGTDGGVAGGKGQATLERLAKKYLGAELPKDVTDADGDTVRHSYAKWLNRPPQEITRPYLHYLALDVIATFWLYVNLRRKLALMLRASPGTYGFVSKAWLRKQVAKHGPQTHHVQLKAAIALDAVSAFGLHVDPERRGPLGIKLTAEVERLKKELAGHGYLPGKGANKALQAILARIAKKHPDIQWPRTDTGKFATRKEVLEDLAVHVPFVDLLLKYRAVEKLKTTFADKLTTPVIHPRFRTLTRSGRTSSHGELNAQNLPRAGGVRECFVPRPGHVFLAADYSTIEMVTLACVCERQLSLKSAMAEAIRAGHDLHRLVAAQVTGKSPADVTKAERSKAKPINFGKPGGMGNATLRGYAKHNYGVDLSEEEVAKMSDGWFASFPEMKQFLADESEAVWFRVAETFGLTPANHAEQIGDARFCWRTTAGTAGKPSKYLGAMLLKVAAQPCPARQRDGSPYPASDIEYFWEKLDAAKDLLPKRGREAGAELHAEAGGAVAVRPGRGVHPDGAAARENRVLPAAQHGLSGSGRRRGQDRLVEAVAGRNTGGELRARRIHRRGAGRRRPDRDGRAGQGAHDRGYEGGGSEFAGEGRVRGDEPLVEGRRVEVRPARATGPMGTANVGRDQGDGIASPNNMNDGRRACEITAVRREVAGTTTVPPDRFSFGCV